MKYVRNCWYVAGWSTDFSDQPRRATILEENIVLYRQVSGQMVALADRCPHKSLPLSRGKVVGDNIRCGYHGLTFDCEGRCVRVPGQDNIPKSAFVRAYPLFERHGIVWIWMGDPARADETKVFDRPEFTSPEWACHHGDALHLRANYLNVADNLCDPAHVAYVHPTTLGNPESEDVPIQSEKGDDDVVVTYRWIRNAPPIGFFRKFGGFVENVDRWHYYYLYPPSTAMIDFGSSDARLNLKPEDRHQGVRILALHFLTPVNATYTIDRWMHIRNCELDDESAGERMDELFRIAFAEDKDVLEAAQLEELKANGARPVRLAIDKGANLYRGVIKSMLESEARA